MKTKLIVLALLIMSSLNAQVPENAEDISPLLVGEKIPNGILIDQNGEEVNLNKVVKQKPTVLIFYRGGWCPYCNQQMASLATT